MSLLLKLVVVHINTRNRDDDERVREKLRSMQTVGKGGEGEAGKRFRLEWVDEWVQEATQGVGNGSRVETRCQIAVEEILAIHGRREATRYMYARGKVYV